MKVFWEKYKTIIIGGLITIVFLPLIYLLLSNFFNKKTKSTPQIEVKQDNNKGDIKNEFIAGNKIVNTDDTQPTIINKGNLSINQKGGNVQQNFYATPPKSPQRNLTNEDIKRLENEIPKDYAVEVNYTDGNEESIKFAKQIVNKLKSLGFNPQISSSVLMMIISDDKSNRFKIDSASRTTHLSVIKQE